LHNGLLNLVGEVNRLSELALPRAGVKVNRHTAPPLCKGLSIAQQVNNDRLGATAQERLLEVYKLKALLAHHWLATLQLQVGALKLVEELDFM